MNEYYILISVYLILTLPNFCSFYNIEAAYYEYRYDANMTYETYYTKRLVHFESICSSCNVQHDYTDDQAYAVKKQIVGLHQDRSTIHGDRHETFDEPRQAQA